MLPLWRARVWVPVLLASAGVGCGTERLPAQLAAGAQPTAISLPAPYPTGTGTRLGERIAALLASPEASRAHWGIAVTAMDGTPLYGLDEGKLFRPASNAKIFTTTAAMALLGPEKTWTTRAAGKLDGESGTVEGDLVLIGGGDPAFGSDDLPYRTPGQAAPAAGAGAKRPTLRDLEEMADQLAARGVKRVTGNVLGDDTLFPFEPYAEGWNQDDAVWGYGAPVSALTIADNQLRLTVTPGHISGPAGHESFPPATVTLEQYGVPFYTVRAQVGTVRPGTAGSVQVEREPGSRILRVYGTLAEDAPPDVEHVAIDDPAAFAAEALRQMLLARGITVAGGARAKHQPDRAVSFLQQMRAPGGCEELKMNGGECGGSCAVGLEPGPVLASHTSAPLAEDVVYTAKVSQNLHAELLLHQLGRVVFCGQGSTLAGARMERAFLLHAGISGDDFVFFDGSGLSTKDLVTPRAEAQLLVYAAKQAWFPQWKTALPIGGVDGSLAARFKKTALNGHLFAKTGTLGESRALAGYVEGASGKTVIFSVLVDNHLPGTSGDREVMDKIVAAIAEEQ